MSECRINRTLNNTKRRGRVFLGRHRKKQTKCKFWKNPKLRRNPCNRTEKTTRILLEYFLQDTYTSSPSLWPPYRRSHCQQCQHQSSVKRIMASTLIPRCFSEFCMYANPLTECQAGFERPGRNIHPYCSQLVPAGTRVQVAQAAGHHKKIRRRHQSMLPLQ